VLVSRPRRAAELRGTVAVRYEAFTPGRCLKPRVTRRRDPASASRRPTQRLPLLTFPGYLASGLGDLFLHALRSHRYLFLRSERKRAAPARAAHPEPPGCRSPFLRLPSASVSCALVMRSRGVEGRMRSVLIPQGEPEEVRRGTPKPRFPPKSPPWDAAFLEP